MRTLITLVAMALLASCASKGVVQQDYHSAQRPEVVQTCIARYLELGDKPRRATPAQYDPAAPTAEVDTLMVYKVEAEGDGSVIHVSGRDYMHRFAERCTGQ